MTRHRKLPRVIYHLSKRRTTPYTPAAGTRMSHRADQYEQDDAAHLRERLRQLRDEFDAATRNTARDRGAATAAGFEFEALRCELDRLRAALTDLRHSTPKPAASTCAPAATCAPAGAAVPPYPPYPPFPPYPPYPPAPPFPPFPPYPPNCGCCTPAPCGCSKCRPTEAKTKVVQQPETPAVPPSSSSSSSSSSSVPGAVGVVYYAQAQTSSSSASYDPNHVN